MKTIIYYRNKCIGCGICEEQHPEFWRMSKKDGKAILLRSTQKKKIFVLPVSNMAQVQMNGIVSACPARSIKLS